MAFPTIDVSKPLGTYRVSTIDDFERETRRWLKDCFIEISGYPNNSVLRLGIWTTDTRPDDPVDRLFGYNTETGNVEYWDGNEREWVNISGVLPEVWEKARCDQYGNVIDLTYATKAELEALELALTNLINGVNVTKLKIWN